MSLSRTRRLRIVPGLLQTILQPNPAEKKMLPFWGNLPMELVYGILEFANYKNRNGMFMSQIEKSDPRCLMLNDMVRVFWFSKKHGTSTIYWWRNADPKTRNAVPKQFELWVTIKNDAITTVTIKFQTVRRPLGGHNLNNIIRVTTTYVI